MIGKLSFAVLVTLLPKTTALTASGRLATRTLHARLCAPRCVPTCGEAEYIFDMDDNTIKFGCQQRTVTMIRPEAGGSLYEFVTSDPGSIVKAAWGPGSVKASPTRKGEFLITLEEFNFATLRIGVLLTMVVSLDAASGTARLESSGFQLVGPGLEQIGEMIDIRVQGAMRPSPQESRVCSLTGDVRFVASGQLPAALRGVPEPALRAAANAVSSSLISAASKRFSINVPNAYAQWAAARSVLQGQGSS